MKKIFTTLLAVMGVFTFAQAQQSKGVELGVGVGYSSAFVSTNNNQTTNSKSGFNVAVSADNYFSDRWSLKVKAIFDQKGWGGGYLTTPTANYTNVDYTLNYLTIPVMANWHFGKTRKWYLNFGPYAGFLLSAKESQFNSSVKAGFNSVDGGLAYGIGVKLPIAEKAKFYIEFDGQAGVANVFKNVGSSNNVRNGRGSFNIGFNF